MERVDVRLVPAALTSWAVTAAGITWPVGSKLVIGCLLVAVFSFVAGRRCAPGSELSRIVTTALLAASLTGAGFGVAINLRTNSIDEHPILDRLGSGVEVMVVPTESPRPIGTGRMLIPANLRAVDGHRMRGRVVVFAPIPGFSRVIVGQPLSFHATISRPKRRDLTVAVLNAGGEPTVGRASAMQRVAASVRDRLAVLARETLPPDQAAILPALVLGDTSAVSGSTAAEFRAAGLTHLMAVSGANVTIVCGAVLFIGRFGGPRLAVGLAALALVAFVVVAQPTASVLRAAVMGAITLLAIMTSRRRQAIPALAATVIILMIAAPHLAVDTGFALSVSATAALVCLAPVWARRLSARGWPAPVAEAVGIAVAAQAVTAPLIAGLTGTLSLVAVLANLAVAALIAPITVLGTAAAVLCLIWPAGARMLIRFTGPELWWLLRVARWTAGLPNATVPVPSGAGGTVLMAMAIAGGIALRNRRWFRCVLAAVLGCLTAWTIAGLTTG